HGHPAARTPSRRARAPIIACNYYGIQCDNSASAIFRPCRSLPGSRYEAAKRVRVSRQMFLARRPSCIRPNNKKPARPWGLMRVFWFRWTPLDFQLAERVGFEPTVRGYRTPDFESGTFDHSATSPVSDFRAGQARWDAACGAGRRGRLADVRTFASEKTKTATISENFRFMFGKERPPCRR